jgi:hypothetical protein
MTDEQLGTAAFVFLEEMDSWKVVEFCHNNARAIRSDGTTQGFDSRERARDFVKSRAAQALLKYYHEVQAGVQP